jgi:hypothetical protein
MGAQHEDEDADAYQEDTDKDQQKRERAAINHAHKGMRLSRQKQQTCRNRQRSQDPSAVSFLVGGTPTPRRRSMSRHRDISRFFRHQQRKHKIEESSESVPGYQQASDEPDHVRVECKIAS